MIVSKNLEALHHYLKPLNIFLLNEAISEISINEPETVFIEKGSLMQKVQDAQFTLYWLQGLAQLIANATDQRLSEKEPLLSAKLPSGHRIQIVIPPASEEEKIILSIRKQVVQDLSLDDYEDMGAFLGTKPFSIKSHRSGLTLEEEDQQLANLFDDGYYLAFLKKAIQFKKNILISGGTSSGKTTLLNACLKEIPLHERLITLEDVREVKLPHPNKVHLIASKNQQGVSTITMSDLVEASLRLRPDRIILGEMRGAEALDFVNATATGHDGSIASIHASNPEMAFMRLTHMMKRNPANMNLCREAILEDCHNVIDIIVQIKRIRQNEKFLRVISSIYSVFNGS